MTLASEEATVALKSVAAFLDIKLEGEESQACAVSPLRGDVAQNCSLCNVPTSSFHWTLSPVCEEVGCDRGFEPVWELAALYCFSFGVLTFSAATVFIYI